MNIKQAITDGNLDYLEESLQYNLSISDEVKELAENALNQLRMLRDLVIPHPRQVVEMTHGGAGLIVRCNDHTIWFRADSRWHRVDPIPQGD